MGVPPRFCRTMPRPTSSLVGAAPEEDSVAAGSATGAPGELHAQSMAARAAMSHHLRCPVMDHLCIYARFPVAVPAALHLALRKDCSACDSWCSPCWS